MAVYILEDFNSLSNGNLNGQNSWSGDTSFQVQGSTVQEGAKSVQCSAGYGSDQFISKNITARTSGIFGIYFRFSATGLYNESLTLRSGTTSKFNVFIRNDACGLADGTGSQQQNLGTSQAINTWHLCEIQIDQANNRARARLNGGSWSSYITYSFTSIDNIQIGAAFYSGQNAFYDYITFTDPITAINLTDSSTIVDTLIRSTTKVFTEAKTIADSFIKSITKLFSESSTGSDSLTRSTIKTLSESKTTSDNLTKQMTKKLSDNSTISDTLNTLKILFKLLVESFTSSDIISKGISKLLTETKSLTDNLSKGLSKVFSEISSITEVFVRYIAKIIELFETTTIFEDFRLFINNKVARWKDLFSSKSSTWNDKDSNKNTNWIDKLKL